ncbi:MAG TPA: DNA polymerase Y family protein [Polyangia bacterium]|jgi:protein ImuB|nr:DNA polymerase Y family protein [Polyangia bacterium]
MTLRLACVFVPQLALQAVLRREPEARGFAVALFDRAPASPHARVVTATEEARRGGVHAGMTGAQADAACPTLRKVCAAPADVATAQAALCDLGYAFAPRIDSESAPQGRIFFEVGDLDRLYPEGEGAIAQGIQARAARLGLGVRVAIASSKGIARVVTRARELAVVAHGGERAFLAPLPVTVLQDERDASDPSQARPRRVGGAASGNDNGGAGGNGKKRSGATTLPEVGVALQRWGIATVGALAMLPAAEVALRLGPAGARAHRLATGVDDEPFVPRLPADALEEGTELDYPIYEIEPLSFILRGLIDRALARLACRSLACAGITLRLALDPRGLDVREILIAAPTRESSTLLDLVRLDLARRPPDAAVVGATLIALPARVRATQLDFQRPAGPAPDRLAATLARLAALVGPENVGAPRAVDSWREEAIAVTPYPVSSAARAGQAGAAKGALAVRRFRPAQEVEVIMGRDGPTALRGSATTARVLIAAGPYRLHGEWWRPPEEDGDFCRDYWDVHASDGAIYRLHQDQRNGRWFLDGYYD